ncbi:NAD-dependent DNA ligase LigA, partial [Mycoplasmopsis pullorum]|uniref:NAD-dependent DNA ligase LigA n=1 Tax=Mycoplasmopsis pullorum TaxID=48003 RepID=UPI00111A0675
MNNKVKEQAKLEIEKLKNQIQIWNHEYYNLDNPSVSDTEYDKAYNKLLELEKNYPEFVTEDSPTQIIGGMANNKFSKYEHQKPMLSLAKAYTVEELDKFYDNLVKVVPNEELLFSLEYKVDGLSIALHYINGKLIRAVTRGDGQIGEDVTENIYQIKSIPKVIDYLEPIEIRGEVFLYKSDFETINQNLEQQDKKTFANPRNAASGTLRQLDLKIVRSRNLNSFLYEIVAPLKHNLSTQKEVLNFLKTHNFPTQKYSKFVSDVSEIMSEIEKFAEIKNQIEYDVDGFVIKLNAINYYNKLGATSKFPKYTIAFKLDTEFAISKIKEINATVGRTGKITYVCKIEPVYLNQTNVENATLHNYNFISEMQINVGDDVKIIKAGEIIPKVIELVQKNSSNIFEKTLNCPSCNSLLEYLDENVDQYCLNEECDEKKIRSLIHFVSRDALNIMSLGDKNINLFYEKGFIKNFVDIFNLKTHKNSILELSSFKEKKTDKILNNIESVRKTKFYRLLFGLGIKHIGLRASKLIAQELKTIENILNNDLQNLIHIKDLGEKSVWSLIEYVN